MCGAFCLLRYMGLSWFIHMDKRKKLRQKYGLKEEPCDDCIVTFCLPECALIQEKRELDIRGL